jgi:hypothetical protein
MQETSYIKFIHLTGNDLNAHMLENLKKTHWKLKPEEHCAVKYIWTLLIKICPKYIYAYFQKLYKISWLFIKDIYF